jgi:hypothetical protein
MNLNEFWTGGSVTEYEKILRDLWIEIRKDTVANWTGKKPTEAQLASRAAYKMIFGKGENK